MRNIFEKSIENKHYILSFRISNFSKFFFVFIIFAGFFLFAKNANAATYNIGPGQTYTTFTALAAAHTLGPDDIVDGGGNTFSETWTVNGSGTSGHPIIIRNATISGGDTVQVGINTNAENYISISNVTIQDILYKSISVSSSSNIVIDTLNMSGKGTLYVANSSNITINNVTSTNSVTAYTAILNFASGTNINVSHATISGSNKGGIYSAITSDLTLNDIEVTGGGDNAYGIRIVGMTSGTISLTGIYSGIERDGTPAGNGSSGSSSYGLSIESANGVLLDTDGIYTSYNRGVGVNLYHSSLLANSILKNFVSSYNTSDGIDVVDVPNLTIQSGTANYNSGNGIIAYGSATTNLVTEYVTANYNAADGIDASTKDTADNCPKGWIVRYTEASYNGVVGSTSSEASGDGFSIHFTSTANYYYVKAIGNLNTGMAHTGTSSGLIYNSIIINNGTTRGSFTHIRSGLYLTTTANPGFTVRNTIVSGNYPNDIQETASSHHNDLDYNLYNPLDNNQFYTSAADGSSYTSWSTYHATQEPHSINVNTTGFDDTNLGLTLVDVDPNNTPYPTDSDFHPLSSSSVINAGIDVGLTTDFEGNTLVDAPDIGVYEYLYPIAPTIGVPIAQSSSSIRWNFTDSASNETGFRIYDNTNTLVASSSTTDLTYLDETGLSENTQYSGRYATAYNSYGNSASSATAASVYTLTDTPTNLSISSDSNSATLTVDSFPNDTGGQSGYYFSRSGGGNSGWIQTNSWTDTGLSCGHDYTYSVKYRNGDGIDSSEISTTKSTSGCGGGSAAFGQPACSGTDCTGGTSSSNSGTTSGSSTSGSTTSTQNFTDISGHWAQDYINQLYNLGITGYVDANGNLLHIFKPDNNISRAELMVMLMKVKYGNLAAVTAAPFSDVAADHWAAPYIAKAKSLGIVDGYSDGTFKPDSSANRAEALKMILLTWFPQDQVDAAAAQTSCSDVQQSEWFAGYFNFALEKGVVSGYKDASGNATGLCGPANDVTRAESAKMIVGTNNL